MPGSENEHQGVIVDTSKYNLWIQKVLATEDDEISCSACFGRIAEYVETEFSGGEFSDIQRQVRHHLHQCLACRDEYELLRDFVRTHDADQGEAGEYLP
jgi:hypothetical protein